MPTASRTDFSFNLNRFTMPTASFLLPTQGSASRAWQVIHWHPDRQGGGRWRNLGEEVPVGARMPENQTGGRFLPRGAGVGVMHELAIIGHVATSPNPACLSY
ncbi:MAG: hypothetical protein ACK5NN_03685, partial [Sphingomonadaceae bacterium]